MVTRVVEFGWTPAQTAEGVGVSRVTAYKWLRRFRVEGRPAFLDQSLPTPPFSTRAPPSTVCCAGTASPGFPIWTGPPGG